MNLQTDDGIREALHEIASWPTPDDDHGPSAGNDAGGPVAATVLAPTLAPSGPIEHRRLGPRVVLVALSLLVAAGVAAVVIGEPRSTIDAASDIGPGLSRATAIDRCLDVETEFNLDQLSESGTVHLLGQPSDNEVYLVISGDSRHAVCGLIRGDGQDWVSVTSLVETNGVLADDEALSLDTTIGLRGRVYVVGQVGASVTTVRIQTATGDVSAQIDDGWWGASFPNDEGILGGFPDFDVSWTTSSGTSNTARSNDIQPVGTWLLCARDESCRGDRLTELLQLAKGLDAPEQATILEDGVVTEEEYRGALRRWGGCIAEETGATVVYDDDGLFSVEGESTTEVFETCEQRHASLVTEAVGLQAASPTD